MGIHPTGRFDALVSLHAQNLLDRLHRDRRTNWPDRFSQRCWNSGLNQHSSQGEAPGVCPSNHPTSANSNAAHGRAADSLVLPTELIARVTGITALATHGCCTRADIIRLTNALIYWDSLSAHGPTVTRPAPPVNTPTRPAAPGSTSAQACATGCAG